MYQFLTESLVIVLSRCCDMLTETQLMAVVFMCFVVQLHLNM